jgi:hypothetical protein
MKNFRKGNSIQKNRNRITFMIVLKLKSTINDHINVNRTVSITSCRETITL